MPVTHRVAPQDPSLSPTYQYSTSQTEHGTPSSIRRNLFAAHLSRRPVASSGTNLYDPSSPTHKNALTRHDVFSSGPALHPTKRAVDMKDIYDQNGSPPHQAASPSMSSNMFTRESIIAVNPMTGKPLLPNLPILPPRLRLSDDDDEGEGGSDEETEPHEYLEYGRPYSKSPSHSRNFVPSSDFDFDHEVDLDSSDLNFIGISRGQNFIQSFMEAADNDESREGRERIERLLGEMMNKQRAKARTLLASDFSANNSTLGVTPAATHGLRSTRAGKAVERKLDSGHPRLDVKQPAIEPTLGGVGATMHPAEKDELMGLIMTSLRRKLQQAEEEGWMYGGAEGLGGIGVGADIGADGIYE